MDGKVSEKDCTRRIPQLFQHDRRRNKSNGMCVRVMEDVGKKRGNARGRREPRGSVGRWVCVCVCVFLCAQPQRSFSRRSVLHPACIGHILVPVRRLRLPTQPKVLDALRTQGSAAALSPAHASWCHTQCVSCSARCLFALWRTSFYLFRETYLSEKPHCSPGPGPSLYEHVDQSGTNARTTHASLLQMSEYRLRELVAVTWALASRRCRGTCDRPMRRGRLRVCASGCTVVFLAISRSIWLSPKDIMSLCPLSIRTGYVGHGLSVCLRDGRCGLSDGYRYMYRCVYECNA